MGMSISYSIYTKISTKKIVRSNTCRCKRGYQNIGFWARGYYVATIGTISEETIKKYIMEQAEEDKKEASSSKL